jgi:hypothetical protein
VEVRWLYEFLYKKLGQYLRGCMNHFWISDYYGPVPEIDLWLRAHFFHQAVQPIKAAADHDVSDDPQQIPFSWKDFDFPSQNKLVRQVIYLTKFC